MNSFVQLSSRWSPDGQRIAFGRAQDSPPNPFVLQIHRQEEPRRITRHPGQVVITDWSADGEHLIAFADVGEKRGTDLFRVDVRDERMHPLVATADVPFGIATPGFAGG